MKKFTIILILSVFVCSAPFAQDAASAQQPVYDRLTYGLGWAFGGGTWNQYGPLPIVGGGLSFQQWFGGIGYQLGALVSTVTGFTDINTQTQQPGGLQTWAGAQVMWRLLAAQFSDWFFSELHLFGGVDHAGFVNTATWSGYTVNFLISAGFGMQAGLFQHFVPTLELGYGVSIPQFGIGLVVRAGLHYRF